MTCIITISINLYVSYICHFYLNNHFIKFKYTIMEILEFQNFLFQKLKLKVHKLYVENLINFKNSNKNL